MDQQISIIFDKTLEMVKSRAKKGMALRAQSYVDIPGITTEVIRNGRSSGLSQATIPDDVSYYYDSDNSEGGAMPAVKGRKKVEQKLPTKKQEQAF